MTTGARRSHSSGAVLLLGLAGLLVAAVAVAALVLAPAPRGTGAAGGAASASASASGSTAGGPGTTSYRRAPEVRRVERADDAPLWWSLAGVSALVLVAGRTLRVATRREPLR